MSGAMRRIAPAIFVGTAAVLVVAGADSGAAQLTGSEPSGTKATPSTGNSSTPSESDDSGQGIDSGTGAQDQSGSDSGDGSSNSGSSNNSDSGTGNSSSGTSGSSSSCDVQEIVGPVVQTQWGPVQVAAKVSNGRVCAIRTIQTPDGDHRSVRINAEAVPYLEQAVLAAGNANFDGVSGATVTTEGYRRSLQAILDRA